MSGRRGRRGVWCRRRQRAPHDVTCHAWHDLDERCTSTQHAQHEGAQHGNAQQGHAQHRVRTARAHAADTCNTSMGGRKRAQRDWRACIAPAQSAAWSGTRAAADDPDVFSRKVSVRRPWSGRSSALPKCRAPCMASVPAQTRRAAPRGRARAPPPTAGTGRRAASSRRAVARAPTGAAARRRPPPGPAWSHFRTLSEDHGIAYRQT